MIIVGGMFVFVMAFMLAVHPYYWPVPAMGNSPPLATRAGWISIAIMPFMFAFSSKVNLIGILTGTPHEKLQVFHRWAAWIMYIDRVTDITSLVHTFPFIRFNIVQGNMVLYWTKKSYYWTGVAALIPQTWLILMSWGPIRSRYYETFKKLHFLATIIFMIFLFIHCNFRLTSWDYFWATGAVYGVTWLTRFGLTLFRNGVSHTATFEALPDRMVRVSIPTTLRWRPGQHYFVRFLKLGAHALTSHPFTVASLADSGKIEFYVRTREGMTGRLGAAAARGGSSAVILDGPYGGVHGSLEAYDRVVLLAGGSGASFTIPLFLDLLKGLQEKKIKTQHVHFVWVVPRTESLDCYQDLFAAALKGAPEGSVTVSLYITDSSRSSSPASNEKDAPETYFGRPNLSDIVHEEASAAGTLGIALCGPDGFALDVRNAVAESEIKIASGDSKCTDIFLHAEAYSTTRAVRSLTRHIAIRKEQIKMEGSTHGYPTHSESYSPPHPHSHAHPQQHEYTREHLSQDHGHPSHGHSHSRRHGHRDKEGGSKAKTTGHRSTRYKEKFQTLRERYDRVIAIHHEHTRDLDLAAAKITRLQTENEYVLFVFSMPNYPIPFAL
ncbi:hypothetical protein H0H81_007386 [Sphagnurus paluster]|uniref:ferric-chelate reductase (NADPH) n=1 Tax=Sphagnurus paluster TaxID=117069 RepID=A0A9P7FUP2_9AGAR|nr:hypothetical protein H0H81_007386 [Sphagnurus paluster]